jgi:hypothetical protein
VDWPGTAPGTSTRSRTTSSPQATAPTRPRSHPPPGPRPSGPSGAPRSPRPPACGRRRWTRSTAQAGPTSAPG